MVTATSKKEKNGDLDVATYCTEVDNLLAKKLLEFFCSFDVQHSDR